jgi:hypothetical protein
MKYQEGKQKTSWFSPRQLEVMDELKQLLPGHSQGKIIREALELLLAEKRKGK